MTREEAIEYWEGLRKTFSSQLEKEENYFGRMHLQTTIDAVDMAISAIRQQEHFRDVAKKVEPLTLDELRQMDGEPVWVQFLHNKIGYWYLIDCHNSEFIRFYRSGFFINGEYSKSFLAYRRKPEEDKHETV